MVTFAFFALFCGQDLDYVRKIQTIYHLNWTFVPVRENYLKLCKNSQGKSEKYSHDLCFHEHQEHKKSYNFSVGQVLPLYFVKEFPVHSLDFPKQT